MSDNFLKDIIKTTGNEYASLVSDGVEAGDVDSFIDTGSYIFNALLSGSIYGGLPANKITAVAGASATGKTYFVCGMVKSFLDQIQMLVFCTLKVKVQLQNRWLLIEVLIHKEWLSFLLLQFKSFAHKQ